MEKCLWIAVGEAREKHCACHRTKAFEITPRIKKRIDHTAIGSEERLRAFTKLRQMIERYYGHSLGSVRRDSSIQVIQQPHPFRYRRRREHPSATQPAQ